jgi:two-component system cell cycle sensor histidine kinase PleC
MDVKADSFGPATKRQPPPRTRGRPTNELKSYRDRLAQGTTNKPEFEYELLTMFARNETSAPFAMPALCFIFYIA